MMKVWLDIGSEKRRTEVLVGSLKGHISIRRVCSKSTFCVLVWKCDPNGCSFQPKLMYGSWKQCGFQLVILFTLNLTGLS